MSQDPSASVVDEQEWQTRFVAMLPHIRRLAQRAFRACSAELREELVADVIADCFIWYRRLVELGREQEAHPTVLTRYATKRVGGGLQVGNPRNRYDISSRYSRLQSGMRRKSLQWRNDETGEWCEMLLACRRASPADLAATRIDFRTWLGTLSVRNRAIALLLAAGEETFRVAERFGLSRGRISQLRRELARSWFQLHGLDATGCEPGAVAA